MDAAVHLPQADLTGTGFSARRVDDVARAAAGNGFAAVCANDHFVFSRPWLDGPTLLARVAPLIGDLDLATTIALSPLRGPVALASALATLASLARGRVVAGVGPGSSRDDYEALGVPFEERWARLDESVRILRALLGVGPPPEQTRFHPMPERWSFPELPRDRAVAVWVASWGSPAGLRRVAGLGDGWLASAYNTDPDRFATGRLAVDEECARRGRDVPLPNALATMWTYVTESPAEATRLVEDVLAPVLRRDPVDIRDRVCVGPAEVCAELLTRYAAAGCQRVHFWPIVDETEQIGLLAERVLPQVQLPA